ncbi:related to aromatic-L-amino-acid decarboxylase [Ramularia collo-cygni]|uniref:Related to aromatic-L-amino-acid decarboxylase n=1 Tax=Ramularia collo-cygni TaxID=112498 RepID=A0A2D3UV40_9PEZI|nr:related to aromatic-L-amino-acid decarboxylase [Ramularia collo-cygni]CZT16870.1 related to aromatic-L-amino-acid decarboxylase [Ramularia collo-cygni]
MDSNQFRQAAHQIIEDIIAQHDGQAINHAVPSGLHPGQTSRTFPTSAPNNSETWEDIHNDYHNLITPAMSNWQAPGFAAFFPGSTSYPSILGELYSASWGGSMFNWICSPAATELEETTMDWLASALALPHAMHHKASEGRGGGIMMGSSSESTLTAMIAARDLTIDELVGRHADVDERQAASTLLVVIAGKTAHSSVEKAARILGLRYAEVMCDGDSEFGMTRFALEQAIDRCRKLGLHPFFVTATLGTTSTCAIDDLQGIGEVLESEGQSIWGHVDASYGGNALICPEYQHLSMAISGFDSFVTNLNKWLLVNADASCFFIKNKHSVIRALSSNPSYLQNPQTTHEPHDLTISLTRRFRALKVWFVFRTFGINGLRKHVRDGILRCEEIAPLLVERPDLFEIVSKPCFGVLTFRIRPGDGSISDGNFGEYNRRSNDVTRRVCEGINATGSFYVTGCEVEGFYVIRLVTTHNGNSFDSMRLLVNKLIEKATRELGAKEEPQAG